MKRGWSKRHGTNLTAREDIPRDVEPLRRDEAHARMDYRQWAEDEHRLWADWNGEFGIDAAEYAAAIARADPSAC
jgi:hypothetical protein